MRLLDVHLDAVERQRHHSPSRPGKGPEVGPNRPPTITLQLRPGCDLRIVSVSGSATSTQPSHLLLSSVATFCPGDGVGTDVFLSPLGDLDLFQDAGSIVRVRAQYHDEHVTAGNGALRLAHPCRNRDAAPEGNTSVTENGESGQFRLSRSASPFSVENPSGTRS